MKNFLCVSFIVAVFAIIATPLWARPMSSMAAMVSKRDTPSANGMASDLKMDAHMRMTELGDPTPADISRAGDILATLRHALQPYRNYHVALAQGFRIFLPSVPQKVYHFVNYQWTADEYQGRFNLRHPGSILYVRQPDGNYALVGAMYSAPPDDSSQQLNNLVPLSIARWHQHVNICLPDGITLDDLLHGNVGQGKTNLAGMLPAAANPEALRLDDTYGIFADGRFGFTGNIHDAAACSSAGGHFLPAAFGWMVHVYPFAGDDLKVAFGTSIPKPAAQ